jgi:pyruvyl transferase EpsO
MTERPCGLPAALGEQVVAVLADLIPWGTQCAVVDAPLHSNVGDSAIWLGQRALLHRLGAEVRYACDQDSYCAHQLAASLPHGPILLHGGGNLGDLWITSQLLRERVIQDFPDRRIIQLPQSVHFLDRANLERARQVFDTHPDLTLLLRDRHSLAVARTEFAAGGVLCPDPAFLLPYVPAGQRPHYDMVWLAR